MQLVKLEIRKLYGTLNKDVTFHKELNLLVGINGSGKTSVLNVIDWLLRADIPRLATTPFERLTLYFIENGKELILEAVQTKGEFNVYLRGTPTQLHPFNVVLVVDPSSNIPPDELEVLRERYAGFTADPEEKPIFEALKSLAKPTVIALDRTISAEIQERLFVENETRYQRGQLKRIPTSPLRQVIRVTSNKYAEYRSRIIQLNDDLKAKIVLSAFRDPGDPFRARTNAKISLKDIEKLERKVTHFASTAFKDPDVAEHTKRFFKRIKTLPARSLAATRGDQNLVWGMLSSQFERLGDLAAAFNDFDKKSSEAFRTLERYLEVTNKFLVDSKKQLSFNETTNRLEFRYLSAKGVPEDEYRDVVHLSSGERQILILLTFLTFNEDNRRVFIVDEPELSLHPKWQEDFLDAFVSLKDPETQLLLATHSPEIVGKHKSACVVLLP